MECPNHRVCDQGRRWRDKIVAVDSEELVWRPWRWWHPLDWFYLARSDLWVRRNF